MDEHDPARHMMTTRDWLTRPDGRREGVPVRLRDEAEQFRRTLAEARADESTIENDWHSGVVALSGARALVISMMLGEFAARVAPGTVTGPIEDGDALADLAADLADDLHRRLSASDSGE